MSAGIAPTGPLPGDSDYDPLDPYNDPFGPLPVKK